MSTNIPANLTPAERSKRSILVGNIPSDVTDEQLRNLLFEFGSIVNFRFFNDSSGNQIGYAFCEYDYQEMAVRAIQKLNDFPFKGHILKVDTAASGQSKEELETFLQGGNEVKKEGFSVPGGTTEKAPEEITKAVASLPAEQMFELMKQIKMCIEHDPQEARNLLLQNPQLSYALLQAQIVMRIVDPAVADRILNRPVPVPLSGVISDIKNVPETISSDGIATNNASTSPAADFSSPNDQDMRQWFGDSNMRVFNTSGSDKQIFDPRHQMGSDPRLMQGQNVRMQDPRKIPGIDPRGIPNIDPRSIQNPDPRTMQYLDTRAMQGLDHRLIQGSDSRLVQAFDSQLTLGADPRYNSMSDPRMLRGQDPRSTQIPGSDPRMKPGVDPRIISEPNSKVGRAEIRTGFDPRTVSTADPRIVSGVDPRKLHGTDPRTGFVADSRARQSSDPRIKQGADPRLMQLPEQGSLPATARVEDPRKPQTGTTRSSAVLTSVAAGNIAGPPLHSPDSMPQDQEKAALILQVLQLSDEQIAMLPPEQRQSILILKEQIAQSHLS